MTGSAAAEERGWSDRLDDPDEPLFTVAVVADLLGIDAQTLRRLGTTTGRLSSRPSGNQRRYSRNDIEILAAAAELASEGFAPLAIGRILDLQDRLDRLER